MKLGELLTPWETLGPQERMKLVLERRAARQAAMTVRDIRDSKVKLPAVRKPRKREKPDGQ